MLFASRRTADDAGDDRIADTIRAAGGRLGPARWFEDDEVRVTRVGRTDGARTMTREPSVAPV